MELKSQFVNFGIIHLHEFDLANVTQCHGLSCFFFPKLL